VAGTSYVLVDFFRGRFPCWGEGRKPRRRGRGGRVAGVPGELRGRGHHQLEPDEQGQYNWVVIRTKLLIQDQVEDEEWRTEIRWAYYDGSAFRIYKQIREGREAGGAQADSGAAQLVDEGTHGLAKLDRVPLFGLRIPEGLWMLIGRGCCSSSTSTNRTRSRGR